MNKQQFLDIRDKCKDDITIFNYPGNVFYCSIGLAWMKEPAVKHFGKGHPYIMYYHKDNAYHGEFNLNALGKDVMKDIDKRKRVVIDELGDGIKKTQKDTESFIKEKPFLSSISACISAINESVKFIHKHIFAFEACAKLDGLLEIKRTEILAQLNLDGPDSILLTTSSKETATTQHDQKAVLTKKYFEEKGISTFGDVKNNSKLMQELNNCYNLGYFLHSGYGGVQRIALRDEFRYIMQINPDEVQKTIQDMEKKQSRIEELGKKFNPDQQFWFEAFRFFSYVRDVRKVFQQKMFCWQADVLDRLAELVGTTREELEYLKYNECTLSAFTSEEYKDLIRKNRSGWFEMWTDDDSVVAYGQKAKELYDEFSLVQKLGLMDEVKGISACKGIVKGKVRIILNPQGADIEEGEILVAGNTSPDYLSLMKKAGAIITEIGGVTSHAAIVSRELGKPCIIGTRVATKVFKDGDMVEVDADNGVVRRIK